ncbi:MAG: hypothetical protein M0Q95_21100, partial [Porticoccaceae bacterium]|nr:hypothetical protein [Porticoccaceae bacterium]
MNKSYRIVWSHSRGQWMVASELARSKAPTKAAASDVRRTVPGFLAGLLPSAWLAGDESGGVTRRNRVASSVAAAVLMLTGGLGAQGALADWTVAGPGGTGPVTIGEGGEVVFEGDDANIIVTVGGGENEGVVTVSLNNNVDLTNAGQLKVDNTVVNSSGVTVGSGANSPSITTSGINAGNMVITGVADGTADDDAVNRGQLNTVEGKAESALTAANAGWDISVGGGTAENVGPGDSVDFSNTDNNVVINRDGTDLTVNLDPDLDVTSVTTGSTVMNTSGVTVGGASGTNIGASQVTVGGTNPVVINGAAGTVTGLSNTTFTPGSITSGRAATEDQLQEVSNVASAGWNVNSTDGTAANVGSGGTVNFVGGDNISVTHAGTTDGATVTVSLDDDITVDSVTTGSLDAGSGNLVVSGTGVTVGTELDMDGNKITNLAKGAIAEDSADAVTGGQLYEFFGMEEGVEGVRYFRANSTDPDAQAEGDNSVAIGPNTSAEGDNSLAAGDGASTTEEGVGALALGQRATAGGGAPNSGGAGAVAIGRDSHASGTSAVALGDDARATAGGATALGTSAAASGGNSIAIGDADAAGGNSFAAGFNASAATSDSIALGTRAGRGTGTETNDPGQRHSFIAIGKDAGRNIDGNQAIAIGVDAGSNTTGSNQIAIGAEAGKSLEGERNISLGYQANNSGGDVDHATSIGGLSRAGTDAVAVGYGANAGTASLALGSGAKAEDGSIALGHNSHAVQVSGAGYLTGKAFDGPSVSVGNAATGLTRRITNVEDGSADYDAVNVRQLEFLKDTLGSFDPESGGNVNYNTDGTITVEAATAGDRAVNLEQMNARIAEEKLKYYSVNPNGDTANQ